MTATRGWGQGAGWRSDTHPGPDPWVLTPEKGLGFLTCKMAHTRKSLSQRSRTKWHLPRPWESQLWLLGAFSALW